MSNKRYQGLGKKWQRSSARPLILGHRGASALEPENTMAAFSRAMRDGADGFELDVRLSACGKLVVYHDDSLERFWQDSRVVYDVSWQELQGLKNREERIPLLSEVLTEFPDALINVEMKKHPLRLAGRLARETGRVIAACGGQHRVVVSSFDPRLLMLLMGIAPKIPRGLLYAKEQSFPLRLAWLSRFLNVSALHPEHSLVHEKMVRKAHDKLQRVNVWTVDQPAQIRSLDQLGVDSIISNDPKKALDALCK